MGSAEGGKVHESGISNPGAPADRRTRRLEARSGARRDGGRTWGERRCTEAWSAVGWAAGGLLGSGRDGGEEGDALEAGRSQQAASWMGGGGGPRGGGAGVGCRAWAWATTEQDEGARRKGGSRGRGGRVVVVVVVDVPGRFARLLVVRVGWADVVPASAAPRQLVHQRRQAQQRPARPTLSSRSVGPQRSALAARRARATGLNYAGLTWLSRSRRVPNVVSASSRSRNGSAHALAAAPAGRQPARAP